MPPDDQLAEAFERCHPVLAGREIRQPPAGSEGDIADILEERLREAFRWEGIC
jgi:hypothetical protein